ncbi:uncharacterized protein F4822DRAFT_440375 [Hypoxylon trugodes]|uniref:uncharacterized protein n=1 Tax=Hypoxylon trugodes TaxID=326681 RepID=UPI002195B54F|nr:uncharacterized protein F4822DRAFT_440375 [Hypoxylon trugodes]KAI1384252.1 hypothetical protein F4822DRAFT_440375 [Hypoxylon trugodes]
MASFWVRTLRAVSAIPFLFIAVWTWQVMNLDKMSVLTKPFADAGVIEWDGGKVTIIDHFHNIDFFDQIWRGGMATFSTSTLGYDSVASWQVFSFLIDLGPVYALWILESYRRTSNWTLAYLPTVFTLAAQFLGIGPVAAVYYFLYITFGPTSSDLTHISTRQIGVWNKSSVPLLPIVLLLHTSVVLAMFLAPNMATRHFWTWAWQLVPFWIGLANIIVEPVLNILQFKGRPSASPRLLLVVLGLISAGVWVHTLLFSPYSLSALFFPEAEEQSEFVPFIRRALQADQLGSFGSSLLWLAYSFFDLYSAGLMGNEWLYYSASLPVITLCVGPGTALVIGWYVREVALASAKK